MKARGFDVEVTGSMGLYFVYTPTTRGKAWRAMHLSKERLSSGEHIEVNGAVVVEGSDRCKDIVIAMTSVGLAVSVNGVNMTGMQRRP